MASGKSDQYFLPTKVCVFASTVRGHSPLHIESARSLAAILHERGIHLVYGGGTSGLMGELAKERVRLGGRETVMGIIPSALVGSEREVNKSPLKAEDEHDKILPLEQGVFDKIRDLVLNTRKGRWKAKTKHTSDDTKVSLLNESIYGCTTTTPSLAARKELMITLIANAGPGSGFIALSGGFGSLDEIMEVITFRQMGMHKRNMVLYNVDGFWDGLFHWVEGAMERGFLREEARAMILQRGTASECVDALST